MKTRHLIFLTALVVAHASAAAAQTSGGSDADATEAWLAGCDAAFNARNLNALATFYDPDVTIYEGGGRNIGWATTETTTSARS